jgi:hypothetical protein
MPTRKQRRRSTKERRHEYETVWVDGEGNELEQVPEDAVAPEESRGDKADPAKAKAKTGKQQPQRGGRAGRTPPPPSWNRAFKRAGLLGIVVFFLFYLAGGKGGNKELSALALAALYTALFVPFTYVIDRFAHNRYLQRTAGGTKPPAKKR